MLDHFFTVTGNFLFSSHVELLTAKFTNKNSLFVGNQMANVS